MAWTRNHVMNEGPKVENRGGYRQGAGKKPSPKRTLSTQLVAEMLKKAKKYARKYGKTIDDVLLDEIYATENRSADRLAAIKLFKDHTSPKPGEGGVTDKNLGAEPALFLPEHRPTLSVVEGSKAA